MKLKFLWILLFSMFSVGGMYAQSSRLNFMGVKIGVDTFETMEKVLFDKGFDDKRYDDINDLYAYRGVYKGMEACVYVSTLEGKVNRVFFRVSGKSWKDLQPIAIAIVRQLKKDFSDFEIRENMGNEGSIDYRADFEKNYEYVSYFNVRRDGDACDIAVTYE